jgi:hypothetical protein
MAEAIVRHVKRSYVARLSNSQITWPTKPEQSIPNIITHAFSGDTLNLFARFDSRPEGDAVVRLEFGGQAWTQRIPLRAYSEATADSPFQELRLARVCAARQIQETTDDTEKQHLGIRYQLQTNRTSYLLVAEREDKDETVDGPALRKVPQMSKANDWQIPDTLFKRSLAPELDSTLMKSFSGHFADIMADVPDPNEMHSHPPAGRSPNVSTLMRRPAIPSFDMDMDASEPLHEEMSPEIFAHKLKERLQQASFFKTGRLPSTLDDLESMGIDRSLLLGLRALHERNPLWDEAELVSMVLYLFTQHPASALLERSAIRTITKSYKRIHEKGTIEEAVRRCFENQSIAVDWRLSVPA